ncbi:MBL fold metallo-hydrolase [Thorsellia kenyensis]|uniref:MBL fold metallo-hydrolase n=1 Tax=Thorsellia kenyensis TaxID=1549888 RepID=A0ABV6CAD9_9GAMM
MQTPLIHPFWDKTTSTFCYVVYDKEGGNAAVIDSVLDYDPKSGRTSTLHADEVIEFINYNRLTVEWILETHAHADHLSAASYLKSRLGGKIAIGENIKAVQKIFKQVFNLEKAFLPDGSQFDYLLKDGEKITIGELELEVISVPGHTPADMAYKIADTIFVGDSLFMPDVGSARCDFPGGSAAMLWDSI